MRNTKKNWHIIIHEINSSEKHIDFQSKTLEDDCRCKTCENCELFLQALKKYFFKQKQKELSGKIVTNSLKFVELGVCSVKSFSCISKICEECPGSSIVEQICKELEKVETITYFKCFTQTLQPSLLLAISMRPWWYQAANLMFSSRYQYYH